MKGEATERLLIALAACAPRRLTRNELIESPELRQAHDMPGEAELSAAAKRNASKTLGRMISAGTLTEVILPNGNSEKLDLPEVGLVAVSVSLPALNAERDKWIKSGKSGEEPSQEKMADTIRLDSINWIQSNTKFGTIPIYIRDIWIVHGSNSFDMMVVVLYRNTKVFMNYVRNVIQRVNAVHSTQTMQISNSLDDTQKSIEIF